MNKRATFAQQVVQYWTIDLPDLPENTPDEVVQVLAEALYSSDPYRIESLPDEWRGFATAYYRQHEDDGLKLAGDWSADGGELVEIEEVK